MFQHRSVEIHQGPCCIIIDTRSSRAFILASKVFLIKEISSHLVPAIPADLVSGRTSPGLGDAGSSHRSGTICRCAHSSVHSHLAVAKEIKGACYK